MVTSMDPRKMSQQLLNEIEATIQKGQFEDTQIAGKLTELKVIARDPRNAPAVYCKSGISVLSKISFGSDAATNPKAGLEAARVIANALLLQADLRQCFADLDLLPSLLNFYHSDDWDHEFVGARILFLLTYETNLDFADVATTDSLSSSLQNHLSKHATDESSNSRKSDQMAAMALVETLKLLFNVSSKNPELCKTLRPTIPSLLQILCHTDIPTPPLEAPVSQILNALAQLLPELPAQRDEINISEKLSQFIERVVAVLQTSVTAYKPSQLDIRLIALITVIRSVFSVSSLEDKDELIHRLLPANEERDRPLGQSASLASQLLQLQASPGLVNIPEAISGMLYELSDCDATTFIKNIGYGHAAGYLMRHNIPIPEGLNQSSSADGQDQHQIPVNPITGQRLDAEPPVDMPELTQEEKEREAERLFVLFERLKATGVVDVENPVRRAMEEGRFEELPDSDPE